jgi:hypothetical protein
MTKPPEPRPKVKREGELLWTEYGGLRYEISEYNPVNRTHYLRVLRNSDVVHLDRLELASARARASALRAFASKARPDVDRVLQHLHEGHQHFHSQIVDELEPVILNGEDIEPEEVQWLWPDRVPRKKLVVFEGDPGLGKSLAVLDLAARLSSGQRMPDGSANPFGGRPVWTVLLSAEDDPADTILPRFIAAGGDRRYMRLLKAVKAPDGERFPNLADVPAIRRALVRTQAQLLIVDPLAAYVPAQSDAWRDDAIRRLLVPITQLVAELDVGLITVRHLTKNNDRPAIYRGQASIGIAGAARAVFVFGKDPGDRTGERRCVATVKFNIGKEPPTIAYKIISEQGEKAHLRWEKGTVPMTADELLTSTRARDESGSDSALNDAQDVLRAILKDGPVDSSEVYLQARRAGVPKTTLERAKHTLNVRSLKDGGASPHTWRWHPPTPDSPNWKIWAGDTVDVPNLPDLPDLQIERAKTLDETPSHSELKNWKNGKIGKISTAAGPDLPPDLPPDRASGPDERSEQGSDVQAQADLIGPPHQDGTPRCAGCNQPADNVLGQFRTVSGFLLHDNCDIRPNGPARSSVTGSYVPWEPRGTDWELIPDGTIQPPGLEYRLNFSAGQREARWQTNP